jgi:hypothetical protein
LAGIFLARAPALVLSGLLLTIAAAIVFHVTGALTAGFSGPDEPAHFVNVLTVREYLATALGSNPLSFATDFYIHYPKVSIGHWPPAYYGILGSLFLVVPPSIEGAFLVNALPTIALGLLVTWILLRLTTPSIAVSAVLLLAVSTIWIQSIAELLLDQALALFTLLAALNWARYAESRRWLPALWFAAFSVAAIMTKGNGLLLALFPLIHVGLTGRWASLLDVRAITAALLTGALTLPWYIITYGVSADGFNYTFGMAYAIESLTFNVITLSENVTVLALALAGFGVWAAYRHRLRHPELWSGVATMLSLVLATLAFQAAVPVAIQPRYLAPALPAVIVLAMVGLHQLFLLVARQGGARAPRVAMALSIALFAAMVFPGIRDLMQHHAKTDLRMASVAELLLPVDRPTAWLIDGGSRAEGALIAQMALHDKERRHFVVRASKFLHSADWMERDYQLIYFSAAEVRRALDEANIQGVITTRMDGQAPLPHSELLEAVLGDPASPFKEALRLPLLHSEGQTVVYTRAAPLTADLEILRRRSAPAKAEAFH